MIIDINSKRYEVCSIYPSTNWYGDSREVIDEQTPEGKILLEKIIKNYPYFDLVLSGENIVDVTVYTEINYTIDTTTITTTGQCIINTIDFLDFTFITDDTEYNIIDGQVEYSNFNVGCHKLILRKSGYKDTKIVVEVV